MSFAPHLEQDREQKPGPEQITATAKMGGDGHLLR
jgi:hypothetical protein